MSQKEVIYRASEAQMHVKFRAFNASTRAVGSDLVEMDISTLEPQAVLRQLRGMLPLGVEILVWPHVVYDAHPGSSSSSASRSVVAHVDFVFSFFSAWWLIYLKG